METLKITAKNVIVKDIKHPDNIIRKNKEAIDSGRIAARNVITNDIKQSENIIKRNKETMDRLRSSQSNVEFNKKQIEKLFIAEKDTEKKIENLKQKYIDIGIGIYDEDFVNNKAENDSRFKKDEEKQPKKNEEKELKKIQNKEILDNEYKMRRYEGPSEYHIKKETDRFFKAIDTIPPFILDNLKNMPCNKGYIWRGVYCYGELPPESKNTIMFEKCRNGLMKIHECINDKIYIYEKIGKGPKKLVDTIQRNHYIMKETERVLSSIGF